MLDSIRPLVVIDLHNTPDDELGGKLQWAAANSGVPANRSLDLLSGDLFARKYDYPFQRYGDIRTTIPTLKNWAQRYLRYNLGLPFAFTCLAECQRNITAASTNSSVDGLAATRIGGAVASMLEAWLRYGQVVPEIESNTVWAARINPDTATGIAAGGTRINTDVMTPLHFDALDQYPTGSGPITSTMAMVIPWAGVLVIEADGYIESGGASERIDFQIYRNGTAIGSAFCSVIAPPNLYDRAPFTVSANIAISPFTNPADEVVRLELRARHTGGSGLARVLRARFRASYTPSSSEGSQARPLPPLS